MVHKPKPHSLQESHQQHRLIALITDFGLSDHYVGTMKAIIAGINPAVSIIDISHEIAPQAVQQAAYLLWAAYRYFPTGTIFLSVVDPGVGSDRSIIIAESDAYHFVAPNNGILDFIISEEERLEAIEIRSEEILHLSEKGVALSEVSTTFHGRDVFAPIVAHLSKGESLAMFGRTITLTSARSPFCNPKFPDTVPKVLHIDRFGNIITNIRIKTSSEMGESIRGIKIGEMKINRWITNYTEAPVGEPCMILGSSKLVEIVSKNASASSMLGVDLKTKIELI